MENNASSARLFAALVIPHAAADTLSATLKRFADSIGDHMPRSTWHLTLAFLGDVATPDAFIASLPPALSLPFFPAVSITHIGEGKHLGQLWAYAQPTQVLQDLRDETHKALHMPTEKTAKEFTPHITLARIHKPKNRYGIRDVACPVTFPAKEVTIFKSNSTNEHRAYTALSTIAIGS